MTCDRKGHNLTFTKQQNWLFWGSAGTFLNSRLLQLTQQNTLAAEVSDCVDGCWEGQRRGTIYHQALKKGAFGQAGWECARGPTEEQKEQLSLTHSLHTNVHAGTQTKTRPCRLHAWPQNKAVHCSPRADRDRRTKAVPQDGHRKHAVQKRSRFSLKWQTPFQTKSRNTAKRHFLFFFGERVNSWTGCFSLLCALPVSGAPTAGESCRTCYHWSLFNGFTSELMLFKWSENRWIDAPHRSGATHNYRNRYKVLREVLRCRWVMEAITFSYGAFLAYWSQMFSAKLLGLCCQCPGRQWQLRGNLHNKSTRFEGVYRPVEVLSWLWLHLQSACQPGEFPDCTLGPRWPLPAPPRWFDTMNKFHPTVISNSPVPLFIRSKCYQFTLKW